MAWDVHLHVCFECTGNEPVAALARKHLETVGEPKEARWFLEDLATRTGINKGPKGGLSLWGIVGNYTNGERFCEALRPFWYELLNMDGPTSSRIVVFTEDEQSEAATAYEIMLGDAYEIMSADPPQDVTIKKHAKLPFAWMQF